MLAHKIAESFILYRRRRKWISHFCRCCLDFVLRTIILLFEKSEGEDKFIPFCVFFSSGIFSGIFTFNIVFDYLSYLSAMLPAK